LDDWDDTNGTSSRKSSPRDENAVQISAIEILGKLEERENHIRKIELELAQTKLDLVEEQCRNQDLRHQV
jgi:hypothetical protein